MIINYLEATKELNHMLEGTDYEEKFSFYYVSSGCTEAIEVYFNDFGGHINIWNSENDECSGDYEGDGDYPERFFFIWVINRLRKLGNDMTFMAIDIWGVFNSNTND